MDDFEFDYRTNITAVALSQNGILALSGSNDGTARLWNTDSGDCIHCFDSKLRNQYTWDSVPVTSVGFVVNGEFRNTVVTGNGDGSIMLWSMEDMGKLLRAAWPYYFGRGFGVTVAMLSHDGSSAFSAVSGDYRLKMWSVASGICIKYFDHEGHIDRAVVSSDGDTLLTACSNGITILWEISSGECMRTFGECGRDFANCADLSRDGKFVISIGIRGDVEIAVLWQVCTGVVRRRFQHPSGEVLCVALSSDGDFALTGANDGSVRIWNTISGDCAGVVGSSVYFGVTAATFAS